MCRPSNRLSMRCAAASTHQSAWKSNNLFLKQKRSQEMSATTPLPPPEMMMPLHQFSDLIFATPKPQPPYIVMLFLLPCLLTLHVLLLPLNLITTIRDSVSSSSSSNRQTPSDGGFSLEVPKQLWLYISTQRFLRLIRSNTFSCILTFAVHQPLPRQSQASGPGQFVVLISRHKAHAIVLP